LTETGVDSRDLSEALLDVCGEVIDFGFQAAQSRCIALGKRFEWVPH
jgi:hypothetical protein